MDRYQNIPAKLTLQITYDIKELCDNVDIIVDLSTFFSPKSVAQVGVSENPEKLGSAVFTNLKNADFKGRLYPVNPKDAGKVLYGEKCVASVRDIEPIDLVIIVVPAKIVSSVVDDCIANKTKNISVITAGFSEVGNRDLEHEIATKCLDNKINLLGPNCLGHISTFANLNASFANGMAERGNIAFISQSGAYCSAMLDWAKQKHIGFSHFISIGNKALLCEAMLLKALKDDKNTTAFVFYLESLKSGKEFLSILREVSKTKPVVIMEPGKSKKAQSASLSHTGSLAPNYRVLEIALQRSGAIQVYNTREMFGLIEILHHCNHKNFDGKIAVLTNAGGFGVLTSDLCEDNSLDLSRPSEQTIVKLKNVLPDVSAFGNPIDIIGDAKSDRYESALKILCESKEYNNILVLLTPQMVTDAKGTAEVISKLSRQYRDVNIFTSFIGGDKVSDGINILKQNHILNFDYPTDVIRLLGLLKKQTQFRATKAIECKVNILPANILKVISDAKAQNLASLPQSAVNLIMEYYKIDYPKSANFTDKNEALNFCKHIFPNPVVLKLSAPDALHKTEMKGIYLHIDDETKFNNAWDSLQSSIQKHNLSGASILIQEMITSASEVIVGINSDKNFGRIMVFGTGGIYTEVMEDTTLRILPTNDFDDMVKETKIGTILNGVRGEEPKAVGALLDTLTKIQQIALEVPGIVAIDCNPILITKTRAVVVDFKMILKS